MAAIGPDRGAWPAVAREEAERLDAKAAGLTAMLARLQAQLEDAAARSRQDARKQVPVCPRNFGTKPLISAVLVF